MGLARAADGACPEVGSLTRGAARLFRALGQQVLREVPLPDGRRADLVALAPDDRLTIIEVKSGLADFRADQKWPSYRAFCDRLVFAVPAGFPMTLVPEEVGIAVVDGEGGVLLRAPGDHPLAASRRRALVGRFARLAAARVEALIDPWGRPGARWI